MTLPMYHGPLQHVNDFCSKMNLINKNKTKKTPVCTGVVGVVVLICYFIASYVVLFLLTQQISTAARNKKLPVTHSTVYGFENKITSFKEFQKEKKKFSKMFFFSPRNLNSSFKKQNKKI